MEQIIQTLLDIDTDGQRLVKHAEDVRRAEQERMEKYKHDMYKRYVAEQGERIKKYKSFAQQEQERAFAQVAAQFDEERARLEEKYSANEARWVEQITDRCIGR